MGKISPEAPQKFQSNSSSFRNHVTSCDAAGAFDENHLGKEWICVFQMVCGGPLFRPPVERAWFVVCAAPCIF